MPVRRLPTVVEIGMGPALPAGIAAGILEAAVVAVGAAENDGGIRICGRDRDRRAVEIRSKLDRISREGSS